MVLLFVVLCTISLVPGTEESKRKDAVDVAAVFVDIDPVLSEILTATIYRELSKEGMGEKFTHPFN